MSKMITEEIMSRKALLAAEEAALTAKKSLHKTLLRGMTDPFLQILQALDADGWYVKDYNYKVMLSPPSTHELTAWQSLAISKTGVFNVYFKVNADSTTLVTFDNKPSTLERIRESLLNHAAKHYVKRV